VYVREHAEQQTVAGHGVQNPRQREHRSDKAVRRDAKTIRNAGPRRASCGARVPREQRENGAGRNDPLHGGPAEVRVNVRERRVGVLGEENQLRGRTCLNTRRFRLGLPDRSTATSESAPS